MRRRDPVIVGSAARLPAMQGTCRIRYEGSAPLVRELVQILEQEGVTVSIRRFQQRFPGRSIVRIEGTQPASSSTADRGTQYTSDQFDGYCKKNNIRRCTSGRFDPRLVARQRMEIPANSLLP
jgi:hypothetical protein